MTAKKCVYCGQSTGADYHVAGIADDFRNLYACLPCWRQNGMVTQAQETLTKAADCHQNEQNGGTRARGVIQNVLYGLMLLLMTSCLPGGPTRYQGPQNPGVMVDQAGQCTAVRSPLFGTPEPTVWSVGCR